ncbi:hypothetical protein BZL54_15065 [Burkholderia ubonensis subsp. mesacidophila]|uniref:Uncharacterized protein n=1 Tax=Burkholderia ubonensis subsp. mesacidophila TaxID=265293 RepID=A0A2A4FEM1_9BURK|nr:hypothetical protein BZL54_15065 [Burkholderia ubonensis subsp. mesacidophila]
MKTRSSHRQLCRPAPCRTRLKAKRRLPKRLFDPFFETVDATRRGLPGGFFFFAPRRLAAAIETS